MFVRQAVSTPRVGKFLFFTARQYRVGGFLLRERLLTTQRIIVFCFPCDVRMLQICGGLFFRLCAEVFLNFTQLVLDIGRRSMRDAIGSSDVVCVVYSPGCRGRVHGNM